MNSTPHPLNASGWLLQIGASHSGNASPGEDAYAFCGVETSGQPARGAMAVVAHGIGVGRNAKESAPIAIHGLVEGYYGAPATLGPGRAAALALSSINSWMYAQAHANPEQTMAAHLAAVFFVGRRARIVSVGDCAVYRTRRDQLELLTVNRTPLSHSVGADEELHIDYIEDASEREDRYILVTRTAPDGISTATLAAIACASETPDRLARQIAMAVGDPASGGATAVVVGVSRLPDETFDDMAATFMQLPIRGIPRDGENWDGFVLKRTLYHSRYTTLKLARDTVSNRDVVLKIPLPAMLHDQVFRAGFLREAWVGATVSSPRIATYIDIPPTRRSSLYLVLPYYRGETLEERLRRAPLISLFEGVGIALKLCAAAQDLGALQIVHRDLKPDNVLLLPGGEIKLLDLGLAYLSGVDEPDDDRLGGTTRYMAPELFRRMPADQSSEVFSLGVTVYRLFSAGAFPFGQREEVPLQRLRPDLPTWLGDCLGRATEIDRAKRFRDAGEFARALQDGLSRGDTRTPPARRKIDFLNSPRFWQATTLLLAVACVALAIALLGSTGP